MHRTGLALEYDERGTGQAAVLAYVLGGDVAQPDTVCSSTTTVGSGDEGQAERQRQSWELGEGEEK